MFYRNNLLELNDLPTRLKKAIFQLFCLKPMKNVTKTKILSFAPDLW